MTDTRGQKLLSVRESEAADGAANMDGKGSYTVDGKGLEAALASET